MKKYRKLLKRKRQLKKWKNYPPMGYLKCSLTEDQLEKFRIAWQKAMNNIKNATILNIFPHNYSHELMDRPDVHPSGKATYGAGGAPNNNFRNNYGSRCLELYNNPKPFELEENE